MPVLHGQAHVRHGGGRRRTALAGWHAEQVESALECAISPEGRHGHAAALCASDGERACAATEAVVERKGGSDENRILRLDSLARACLALLNLYASVIPYLGRTAKYFSLSRYLKLRLFCAMCMAAAGKIYEPQVCGGGGEWPRMLYGIRPRRHQL